MRTKLFNAAVLLALMVLPSASNGQFPGMGGGGMGFDMSKMNPDFLFGMLSKGKDVINRDEMDERSQRMFDRFAPLMGIQGTVITKDQFRESMAKVQEMAKNGQLPIPGMGGAPGAAPGGGFPGMAGGGTDRLAEERFKQYDKNQDGVISIDELPEDHALRNEREKYDTNKDGVYDLNEFKVYVTARLSSMGSSGQQPTPPTGDARPSNPQDNDPDRRPTIVRPANLPKDLPSWFAELDRAGDRDGQVGLYEWKEGGKKITEFLTMDLNSDGFLTVDEYYRWKKKVDEEARKNGDSASDQYARGGRGDRGSPNGDRGAMMMGGRGDRGDRGGPPGGGFPGMGGGDRGGDRGAPPGGGFPGMGGGRFPGMGGGDRGAPPSGGPGGGRFPGMGSGDRGAPSGGPMSGRFPGMGSGDQNSGRGPSGRPEGKGKDRERPGKS